MRQFGLSVDLAERQRQLATIQRLLTVPGAVIR